MIILILPPRNIQVLCLIFYWVLWKIKVSSVGAVILFETLGGDVDFRFSCFGVEPLGDICTCRVDEGLDLFLGDVKLDVFGKVVDLAEEGDPDIVGSVVLLELGVVVVATLFERLRDEFFSFGHGSYIYKCY